VTIGQPIRNQSAPLNREPGIAAHPCLRGFRQWPIDRSMQARMGGDPRRFALPARRVFHCFFAVDFLDCSSRLLSRVCSLKELFGARRSNAKKSATHKQIGAAEASSLMDGQFHGQVSLTEMDQT
jgi:hypothetical protein